MEGSAGATRTVPRRFARIAAWVGCALLLAWAGLFLLGSPTPGAADRGDFWRVGKAAGIVVPRVEATGPPSVRVAFDTRQARLSSGPTTAAAVASVAKHTRLLGPSERFDLRNLGLVYLAGLALLVAAAAGSGVPPGLCALVTFVAVDAGYLIYFNSLYSEAPLLLALFGIVVWLLRWGDAPGSSAPWPRIGGGVVAGLLVLLLAAGLSRFPASIVPLLASLCLFAIWLRRRPPISPSAAVTAGLLLTVSVVAPLHFTVGKGPRFPEINGFHAVFVGIAQESDEPEAALRRLGIDPKHSDLRGRSYFEADPPPTLRARVARLSRAELAWSYVADPGALAGVVTRLGRQLATGRARVDYSSPDADRTPPPSFSPLRQTVLGLFPPMAWLIPTLALGVAFVSWRKPTKAIVPPAALAFLGAFVWVGLPGTVLGDGLYGLGRHLLPIRYAFDLSCVLLLWHFGAQVVRRFRAAA